jgi:menaquinone-dependent protoporphyrinogen oxidase
VSKVLVVYASHYGQTRAIAVAVAERLRVRGARADVFDARFETPSPEGYDAAVFGSRVELGHHAYAVVDYLRRHREILERMPTGVFSVSMAAAGAPPHADPSGYLATLFEQIDWKPTCSAVFAGGLPYRKYNWLTRLVMKRISKAAGHTTDTSKNHEFTSWPAVHAFADELADRLSDTIVAHQML